MVELEYIARTKFEELLRRIPFAEASTQRQFVAEEASESAIDFVVRAYVGAQLITFACEVKSKGEPKLVRHAISDLHLSAYTRKRNVIPVLICPYLSPAARAICKEVDVGYLDFEGNAFLSFDTVLIDIEVASKPSATKRGLGSLFSPKSSQVLQQMLREPRRPWRVADLVDAAGVSLGQVSKVTNELLLKEFAMRDTDGIFLSQPDKLLDVWVSNYRKPTAKRMRFYSPLHGREFHNALAKLFELKDARKSVVLSGASAAEYIHPHLRSGIRSFYANENGLNLLIERLKLTESKLGENVVVDLVTDSAIFDESQAIPAGLMITNAVQTYLDLSQQGERGREAAEQLRQSTMRWNAS